MYREDSPLLLKYLCFLSLDVAISSIFAGYFLPEVNCGIFLHKYSSKDFLFKMSFNLSALLQNGEMMLNAAVTLSAWPWQVFQQE